MADSSDAVFKALADPTRRSLLDRLRQRDGQTLGELCEPLSMARQSATQHLEVLEAANLISTVRDGREKLHYLNPVPLWDIYERWIECYEDPRLRALSAIKRRAEESMGDRSTFRYVTYIQSTPERVWQALTDPALTRQYWGHDNNSEWRTGSTWEHRRVEGSGIVDVAGSVIEAERPRRLVMTWASAAGAEATEARPSTVTFDIESLQDIVRLTVSHVDLDDREFADTSAGWPAVLANLKSLLETGQAMSTPPWEMASRAEAVAAGSPER